MKFDIINSKLPLPMIDISDPDHGVEVTIIDDKIWINVDGYCVMRVAKCKEIVIINDNE